MKELGGLSSLAFARTIRERYQVRTFICEPGPESFRQYKEGNNPEFNGINALEPDQETLKAYCESYRSDETQSISGIFLRPDNAFQPNESLPKLVRPYPILLVFAVSLRESLVHEFIHYLIHRARNPVAFHRLDQEYDRWFASLEPISTRQTQLGEIAEKRDWTADEEREWNLLEMKTNLVQLKYLPHRDGEEMDVYRYLVENGAAFLGICADGMKGSRLGFLSRLQPLVGLVERMAALPAKLDELARLTRKPVTNEEKSLLTEMNAAVNLAKPKLRASYEWFVKAVPDEGRFLSRYAHYLTDPKATIK
ncbi:MAG: hypothetical protein AB7P04_15370 [Bacteriovoracia bacterium]